MVALLPLVLIPLVISGFLLVYTLVGGVLEGDGLQRWVSEARGVALPTVLVQIACCLGIVGYARYRGLPWRHLLNWMSLVNIALALILIVLVFGWSS